MPAATNRPYPSDYACPFCKKFYDTFTEKVLPNYGNQLKFVMYHQVQPWQGLCEPLTRLPLLQIAIPHPRLTREKVTTKKMSNTVRHQESSMLRGVRVKKKKKNTTTPD